MDTSGHTLYYQDSSRPAPPSGPTPMYARTLQRFFPYSLRPVILFSCIISLLYLVLLGGNDFRDASKNDITTKLKIFNVVEGILFMVAAAVELFGFYTAYTQRLPLARIYSYLSLVAYGAVLASEILGVIVIFTDKKDVIASCTAYYTGATASAGSWWSSDDNSNAPMTATQAASYCQRLWSSSRTWDIIWLFVSAFVGALFVAFSFAYVRQLLDPSSVKMRVSRFQQQHNGQATQAPYDPAGGAFTYPPQTTDSPYGAYAPPPGPPPNQASMGAGDLPGYQGRRSMDDYDGDAKTPADYGYGYNYGPGERNAQDPFRNPRPGSSRNVAMHPDDEDDDVKKRNSDETLRGEETIKKIAPHNDDDHHDGTPRI